MQQSTNFKNLHRVKLLTCGFSSISFIPFTSWLRNLALSVLLNKDLRTDAICTRQESVCNRQHPVNFSSRNA